MNRNMLCKIFLFTVGAAIGSAVTWKLVKTKYEQIAQEEIDSVKEEYANLMQSMKDKLKGSVVKNDEEDVEDDDEDYPDDDDRELTEKEQAQIDYYKLTSKYRSKDAAEENNEEGDNGDEDEEEVPYINGPYVISADDFNSSPPGYNAQPLDYFADGILADSWGVQLDIEETIGEDSLDHFGEDQDDILYVRNERNEIDYEVTRDPRTYGEAVRTSTNPYYGQ